MGDFIAPNVAVTRALCGTTTKWTFRQLAASSPESLPLALFAYPSTQAPITLARYSFFLSLFTLHSTTGHNDGNAINGSSVLATPICRPIVAALGAYFCPL